MRLRVTRLENLMVNRHQIPAYGSLLPNTSLQHKPLFIYKQVFRAPSINASLIEDHLNRIGVVEPQWRDTMYSTTHFHSTTHEVLWVVQGSARLCFGHEANADRVEIVAEIGDVLIIPAGVGHRLLEEVPGSGFEMIGAYPIGAEEWDMCYGVKGEKGVVERIKKLPWFERDPIYGDRGPCLEDP